MKNGQVQTLRSRRQVRNVWLNIKHVLQQSAFFVLRNGGGALLLFERDKIHIMFEVQSDLVLIKMDGMIHVSFCVNRFIVTTSSDFVIDMDAGEGQVTLINLCLVYIYSTV